MIFFEVSELLLQSRFLVFSQKIAELVALAVYLLFSAALFVLVFQQVLLLLVVQVLLFLDLFQLFLVFVQLLQFTGIGALPFFEHLLRMLVGKPVVRMDDCPAKPDNHRQSSGTCSHKPDHQQVLQRWNIPHPAARNPVRRP